MKKILFILLGLVLMFTLVGCKEKEPVEKPDDKPIDNPDNPNPDDPNPDNPDNPDTPDPEPEKGLTVKNLQEALLAVEKEYNESKKAAVSVELKNGEETMSVLLVYELNNDNLYKSLQYELVSEKTVAIYIKDDVVYSTANGTKSKETLDETVNETIANDYGLQALLQKITAFYKENGLYNCLTLASSSEEGVYVFDIDLVKYAEITNATFKAAGKDKISIIVTTVDEKITSVKVETTAQNKVSSTTVNYLGFDKNPQYPSDLDTYK